MAINHRMLRRPAHFSSVRCNAAGCFEPATMTVLADRKSASGNLREYTVGSYCERCATALLARMKARTEKRNP